MKVITWVNRITGRKTNRVEVRVTHRLSLDEMADALLRHYHDSDERPASLSAKKILDAVRESYEMYGTNAVWAWSDSYGMDEAEDLRRWARGVILRVAPELGDHDSR